MGLNKDGLKRFSAVAASHVGDDKVPGLVALVAQGDDVHVETLGTLTVGGRPVERTSLFRIASTTKPITANKATMSICPKLPNARARPSTSPVTTPRVVRVMSSHIHKINEDP